jgi:hypothetical protein
VPVVLPVGTDTISEPAMSPKVAVTVVVDDIATVQLVAATLVQPLQVVKVAPGAGVAVSTTMVPAGIVSLQSAPHEIPAGMLVTVPLPAPVFTTFNCTDAAVSVRTAVFEGAEAPPPFVARTRK